MKPLWRPWGALAIAALNFSVLGVLYAMVLHNAGEFAYPLDDTYIHEVVAWNLVENGTWGINPGQFASASSSPVWVLLLAAGFALFGRHVGFALILAVLASVGSLLVADRWLWRSGASSRRRILGLFCVSVFTPLPVMAGLGMEHTLQLLVTLALAATVERASVERTRSPLLWGGVLGLCAIAPLIRYEHCILIAFAGAWLIWRSQRTLGIMMWVVGALAVLGFGLWSIGQGASFLPNGLLMKSMFPYRFVENIWTNAQQGAAVWLLVITVVWTAPRRLDSRWLFALVAAIHLIFAGTGWYYRYEAYLMGWGSLLLSMHFRLDRQRQVWFVLVILLTIIGGKRSIDAIRFFQGRCVYIFDVKVQLARALDEVAPDTRLALHDIGAMAWYTDVHIIDIAGLGDDDITRLSASHRFTGQTISEAVFEREGGVGFATATWMSHDPPPEWVPIAALCWGIEPMQPALEPLIAYELAPSGAETIRRWLPAAAAKMDGRGWVVSTGLSAISITADDCVD
ncbi:MAG: hypothetical protein AAFV53_19125 [Myxococcota bacterium]